MILPRPALLNESTDPHAANTALAAVLESEEIRNARPYNEAFYQTLFMVNN